MDCDYSGSLGPDVYGLPHSPHEPVEVPVKNLADKIDNRPFSKMAPADGGLETGGMVLDRNKVVARKETSECVFREEPATSSIESLEI